MSTNGIELRCRKAGVAMTRRGFILVIIRIKPKDWLTDTLGCFILNEVGEESSQNLLDLSQTYLPQTQRQVDFQVESP